MTLSRRLCFSLILAGALALPAAAQHHRAAKSGSTGGMIEVTGVITDQATGQPILGATVSGEGQKSTPTDATGHYGLWLTRGHVVALTADHFAYNSATQSVTVTDRVTLNFALTGKPAVTVKLVNGETHILDYATSQFAYVITFSGYVRGDAANICKNDGTTATPDKSTVSKVIGPGVSVNQPACCTIGPLVQVNFQMKDGTSFPANFIDSCYGYNVDFLGRERSTGNFLYFHWTDIAEVDFP